MFIVKKMVLLISLLLLISCNSMTSQPPVTLYERLGAEPGVASIVDHLLYEIGENEVLRPVFAKADIDRFRSKLIEHICALSDGPCHYSGDNMTEVHAGIEMNNKHFDAMVTALSDAMTENHIASGAQNALLARLVPLHGEIMHEAVTPSH